MNISMDSRSFQDRVGQVLVEGGLIESEQLMQAQETSRISGDSLFDTLVSSKMLSEATLMNVISFQLQIPVVDLRHAQVDPEAVRLIPEKCARQYVVLPLDFGTDGSLHVATKAPNDFGLSALLSKVAGCQVKFRLAIGGRLEELINKAYAPAGSTP